VVPLTFQISELVMRFRRKLSRWCDSGSEVQNICDLV